MALENEKKNGVSPETQEDTGREKRERDIGNTGKQRGGDAEERRIQRHKRRVRNQIIAYVVLAALIILCAFGIVSGVRYLTSAGRKAEEADRTKQEQPEDTLVEVESSTEPESSSEPEPEVVEPTFEEKLDALVDDIIAQMTLEDKVAGLFFVSPENITGVTTAVRAGDATKEAVEKYPVGGILYQGKNIQSEEQIREMLSKTKGYAEDSANHNLFLAVREEGGDAVQVAAQGLGTKTDSAKTIGESQSAENAYKAGTTIGGYLGTLGFNLDFAPVADLTVVENSAVGSRSYGSDETAVSGYVSEMMRGLHEQGIYSAVVQFPGTGAATAKTEDGLSSTDRSAEDFRNHEFVVFSQAIEAGAEMIMVSHMSAPALDDSNTPCSLSESIVTGILREKLGFRGIIISEEMNKTAISEYYGADEAAVDALRAGCDMILVPEDFEKAYNGVLQAVADGRISEERINDSLKRIYRVKYADMVE